jgi:hypothetical protein
MAWSEDIGASLRADKLSMPAGELGTSASLLPAFIKTAAKLGMTLTHVVAFTDSNATKTAVNGNAFGSLQLNFLVQDLFETLDGEADREATVQLLAVHVPGMRNCKADCLSRIAEAGWVLQEVAEST